MLYKRSALFRTNPDPLVEEQYSNDPQAQQVDTTLEVMVIPETEPPHNGRQQMVLVQKRMWNNFTKSLDLLRSLVNYLVDETALYEHGPNTCIIPMDDKEAAMIEKLVEARDLINEVVHGWSGNEVKGFFKVGTKAPQRNTDH